MRAICFLLPILSLATACGGDDDSSGSGGSGAASGSGGSGASATGGSSGSAGTSSGGSAGSATGGASGGGGAGGGTVSCTDCVACIQANCTTEITACQGQTECGTIYTCASACGAKTPDQCVADNPGGLTLWAGVSACLNKNCLPKCS